MCTLLLAGEVKIQIEGIDEVYKLEDLTSMISRTEEYVRRKEKRFFTLFCTASKKQSQYRVKIELYHLQGDSWYIGRIIFPKAPV